MVSRIGCSLVLMPALVGHAGRPDPRVRSFDDEVERLALLVRRAAFGPAHLAGYSLGARLALALLLAHPDLFSSATLIGVHPGLAHPTERAARQLADAAWCRMLEEEGIDAFVAAWEAQPLFSSQSRVPRARLDEQRAERRSHQAAGLIQSLCTTGLGRMPDLAPRLGEIAVVVELLVGELDPKFRALAEEICGALAAGRVEVVSDAGHNLLLEAPDSVVRAITREACS